MIDPVTAAASLNVLGKIVKWGLAARDAWNGDGAFDDADIKALQSALDAGSLWASLRGKNKRTPRPGAMHLAIVTRAFGTALARYWRPVTVPPALVDHCLAQADARFDDPYDQQADASNLAWLNELARNPLAGPYYRALWDAFQAPEPQAGQAETLSPLGEDRPRFERLFRGAYAEAMATTSGARVQAWLLTLTEETQHSLRYMLAQDMAAWGNRHVFGNLREQTAGDPMPSLRLDECYVEPTGWQGEDGAPVIERLNALLHEHRLVVVTADFGNGKSLTARRLARDHARAWLDADRPTPANRFPVFIKCPSDIRKGRYDHEDAMRNALYRAAADAIDGKQSKGDEMFAPVDKDHSALFILDGLDEVALAQKPLEDLFQTLDDALGSGQRAIVFTRPGALHNERCLPEGTPVVELRGFDSPQIARWLETWNQRSGRVPLTLEQFGALAELAKTPILLLMIAMTWQPDAQEREGERVALYERFFRHIARGKYEMDENRAGSESHDGIRAASNALAEYLQEREVLDERDPIEAMLWLMSRVAWEAHVYRYEKNEVLDVDDVRALVKREVGRLDLDLIQLGLMLTLQVDPTRSTGKILFDHQSFREFLVARFWKHQLHALVQGARQRSDIEARLWAAPLRQDDDKAFDLLVEMLRASEAGPDIRRWAQRTLEIREVTLHEDIDRDRRPVLWVNVLAAGSSLGGLELGDKALRLICFWHQFYSRWLRVWAPDLRAPRSVLFRTNLFRANLSGADLKRADLRWGHLSRANLSGADLAGADLSWANLFGVDLAGADLSGANLFRVDLGGVDLGRANLSGANLIQADLSGANLFETDLSGADLFKAKLGGADLRFARVGRRQLERAVNLDGVIGLDTIIEP